MSWFKSALGVKPDSLPPARNPGTVRHVGGPRGSEDPRHLESAIAATNGRQREVVEAFHGQIYISNQLDVQHGRLWDCMEFKAGEVLQDFPSARFQFFSNVGPISGKGLVESNMTQPKRLDAPEAFSVQRVLFTFNKFAADEDVYGVAESVVYNLWLGQKRYLWSPLIALQTTTAPLAPIRCCVFCQSMYVDQERCPGCGAQEFRLDQTGEFESGKCFFLDLPKANFIVIANQMSFWVTCEIGNHSHRFRKDLKMWCHLEGLHARGVQ